MITINDRLRCEDTDSLFTAIMKLKNADECYNFFEDLCTVSEIKAMSQRFKVARMLSDNTVYSEIVEKTGASTATISRVNRCLNYGNDGYKKALENVK